VKRVWNLSTADRVVDRGKWPVRRSSWRPPLDRVEGPCALRTRGRLHACGVTSSVHLDVLRAWCAYSQEVTPLFPNLSQLRWAINDHSDLDIAPLLLVPSLLSLTVLPPAPERVKVDAENARNPGATVVAIHQEAMLRCPTLHSFHIFRGWSVDALSFCIQAREITLGVGLQQLRTFRCGTVPPNSTLRHLASLPHLEEFEAPMSADLSLGDLPCMFPAALELRFLRAPMQQLDALVEAVQSPRVHTLELSTSDEPSPRHIGALLARVAAHPSAGALRRLSFAPERHGLNAQPGYLALDDVRPLMCVRGLRDVVLNGCAVDPVGDAVAQMLDAWPTLETLELEPGSRLTLAQVLAIARTHGALRELRCTVVVRAGAPLLGAGEIVHAGLQHMQLEFEGEDTPTDWAAVAHLLVTVFTGMNSFEGVPWHVQGLISEGRQSRLAGRPRTLSDYKAAAESH
jgi:hypothetical protein